MTGIFSRPNAVEQFYLWGFGAVTLRTGMTARGYNSSDFAKFLRGFAPTEILLRSVVIPLASRRTAL